MSSGTDCCATVATVTGTGAPAPPRPGVGGGVCSAALPEHAVVMRTGLRRAISGPATASRRTTVSMYESRVPKESNLSGYTTAADDLCPPQKWVGALELDRQADG